MVNRITLIPNRGRTPSLTNTIKPLIATSKEICIAVAFLKFSGFKLIEKELKKALVNKAKITFVIGKDFGITEPAALQELYNLFKNFQNADLYLAESAKWNFHTKLYLFKSNSRVSLIVGSSNLTQGGLKDNEELSLNYECSDTDTTYQATKVYFNHLLDKEISTRATQLQIERYKPYHNEQEKHRKKTPPKPAIKKTEYLIFENPEKLRKKYERFSRTEGVSEELKKRKKDYAKARKLLKVLAELKQLNKTDFIEMYEKLVGGKRTTHLWHSDGLFRSKTKVFSRAKKFQEMAKFVEANTEKSASFLYDGCKTFAEKIPGIAENVITELLITYNPQKFAILNNSPIKGLSYFGVELKGKTSFDGEYYSQFCDLMIEIKEMLKLDSLLELDAFFNFVYWKYVKKARE